MVLGREMKQGVVVHRASIDDQIDCVARGARLHILNRCALRSLAEIAYPELISMYEY
jgi:hypothetical protein